MGLANCPECGKLYVENPSGMCVDCFRREQEDEDTVAKYLRNRQNSSIEEIHEATKVDVKVILKMIRKGRVTGGTIISYPCDSCRQPITSGKYCKECSSGVLDQVKQEPKPEPKPEIRKQEGIHMHFKK